MKNFRTEITIDTEKPGLHPITQEIERALSGSQSSGVLHIFIMHTSASLLIQENSDPTAKADLEEFFTRLAPEHESWHRHTIEGSDDTVSHLKSAVLPTSLMIPIENGQLKIGTWQGVYLFEHRRGTHKRRLLLTILENA